MSKNKFTMEFGNFICKFGRKKGLLSMFDEVVSPAFFDKKMFRHYGDTKYFLYDVELVNLTKNKNEPVAGIVGRIIKDTLIEREQIFEESRGLVKDSRAIRSSPSAIFLLILNNHRLIYIKETRDAPTKETFGHTILNFLYKKHQIFINEQHEKLSANNKKITKTELKKTYPRPSLDIISLTSDGNIKNFINKYDTLKKIEIRFQNRNDEVDNDHFFEMFQKKQDAIKSDTSKLTHYNKDGLEKAEAIREVQDATAQGNQFVKLSGTDESGDKLDGNNEIFQLKKTIQGLTGTLVEDAANMYDSFVSLKKREMIKVLDDTERIKDIILSLINGIEK